MRPPEFLITVRSYCVCGQMHESITHLVDHVNMTLSQEPFDPAFFERKPLPTGIKLSARKVELSGECGKLEFEGVAIRGQKLVCVGCGGDVLFDNPGIGEQ